VLELVLPTLLMAAEDIDVLFTTWIRLGATVLIRRAQSTSRTLVRVWYFIKIWRCIQRFLDWHPGARTANGITLCH